VIDLSIISIIIDSQQINNEGLKFLCSRKVSMSLVCTLVKQSISSKELNNSRGDAPPSQSQLGKPNYALSKPMLPNLGDNNIGNMGCKYLSRASLNRIQYLWIRKSKIMKTTIKLEARECSISPRRSGVHSSH
jgi:hypothetical protein